MNRKLHNTVIAMIASSSLFVLGLLTAAPLLGPVPAPALATSQPVVHGVAAAHAEPESQAAAPRRQVRSRRQSVAMPFFSFAPRG